MEARRGVQRIPPRWGPGTGNRVRAVTLGSGLPGEGLVGRGAGSGGAAGPGGRRAGPGPGRDCGLGRTGLCPRPRRDPAPQPRRAAAARPGAEAPKPGINKELTCRDAVRKEPPPPAASRAPKTTPPGGRGHGRPSSEWAGLSPGKGSCWAGVLGRPSSPWAVLSRQRGFRWAGLWAPLLPVGGAVGARGSCRAGPGILSPRLPSPGSSYLGGAKFCGVFPGVAAACSANPGLPAGNLQSGRKAGLETQPRRQWRVPSADPDCDPRTQEDPKLKVILSYLESSRPAWPT